MFGWLAPFSFLIMEYPDRSGAGLDMGLVILAELNALAVTKIAISYRTETQKCYDHNKRLYLTSICTE